jgi:ADP-ribose pyrophosphatase YjhB (NUDIX family)
MTTDRVFCRFSPLPETAAFSVTEVPAQGIGLSSFLLLSPPGAPTSVLLGHMDPRAPWGHLGALDPGRAEAHAQRWTLPASHLILRESPQVAAQRILSEQLDLGPRALTGPEVVSEVGLPVRPPARPGHWDLLFLFRGELPPTELRPHPAWRELRFVDSRSLRREEMGRSHEDVLAAAGFPLR